MLMEILAPLGGYSGSIDAVGSEFLKLSLLDKNEIYTVIIWKLKNRNLCVTY